MLKLIKEWVLTLSLLTINFKIKKKNKPIQSQITGQLESHFAEMKSMYDQIEKSARKRYDDIEIYRNDFRRIENELSERKVIKFLEQYVTRYGAYSSKCNFEFSYQSYGVCCFVYFYKVGLDFYQ